MHEMLIDGWPVVTEANGLHALLPPLPPVRLFGTVGGDSSSSPPSKLLLQDGNSSDSAVGGAEIPGESNIPWRRASVHHSDNELFVDVREWVEGTFDAYAHEMKCPFFIARLNGNMQEWLAGGGRRARPAVVSQPIERRPGLPGATKRLFLQGARAGVQYAPMCTRQAV